MTRVAERALARYRDVIGEHSAGTGAGAVVEPLTISENATFRVRSGSRCWVLRVHRLGYHTPAQIGSELAWLDAVRADVGLRTPRVLATDDGYRVALVDDPAGPDRCVVLFEHLPGVEPPEERLPALAGPLGELTARLHRHVRSWRAPAGFDRFRWDLAAALGPGARWGDWRDGPGVGPDELAVLDRAEQVVRRRLSELGEGQDRFGLIHADLRAANLLVPGGVTDGGVTDGGEVCLIDFDDCGFGWFLYDFAATVSFVEDRPDLPEIAAAWLEGYRRVRPLSPDVAAELDTMVVLRRLQLLAWIGSHAAVPTARALAPGFAAGSAALAQDYLVRHG